MRPLRISSVISGRIPRAEVPSRSVNCTPLQAMVRGPTRFPTSNEEPSGAQARVCALPRPLISLTHAFVLTSQSFTTPSLLTLQSSASLTGLKAIFSIAARWPRSSVEFLTSFLSGFPASRQRDSCEGKTVATPVPRRAGDDSQTRSVLSEVTVATKVLRGFQAICRNLDSNHCENGVSHTNSIWRGRRTYGEIPPHGRRLTRGRVGF